MITHKGLLEHGKCKLSEHQENQAWRRAEHTTTRDGCGVGYTHTAVSVRGPSNVYAHVCSHHTEHKTATHRQPPAPPLLQASAGEDAAEAVSPRGREDGPLRCFPARFRRAEPPSDVALLTRTHSTANKSSVIRSTCALTSMFLQPDGLYHMFGTHRQAHATLLYLS